MTRTYLYECPKCHRIEPMPRDFGPEMDFCNHYPPAMEEHPSWDVEECGWPETGNIVFRQIGWVELSEGESLFMQGRQMV
jgi:hypothetical protein